MSDAALILRARGGDELAFRRLIDRHGDLIDIHASRYYLPGATKADLRQEGLIGLHKAVRDYKRGHVFRAFASLCIDRQMQTAVITANRGKHRPLNERVELAQPNDEGDERDEDAFAPFADHDADPQELVARVGRIRLAAAAIRSTSLTDLEQLAFDMIVEGASYEEIAEELGCAVKVIDNALQRGKRKLATALEAA